MSSSGSPAVSRRAPSGAPEGVAAEAAAPALRARPPPPLEIERGQRVLLQYAYNETVAALASALESKDTGTRAHSQRVQRYALELARAVEPRPRGRPERSSTASSSTTSARSGSRTGSSRSRGRSTMASARLMRDAHAARRADARRRRLPAEARASQSSARTTSAGTGAATRTASRAPRSRSAARIFAVADSLDAMTSDRPYRAAFTWATPPGDRRRSRGQQFDPSVVDAFLDREDRLLAIRSELAA